MSQEAKYIVRLTEEERQTLQQLVAGPRVARAKALRAPAFVAGGRQGTQSIAWIGSTSGAFSTRSQRPAPPFHW